MPSGTSVSEPNTIGITVAAMSMITVPATTGVNILRSSESRAASANWNSDDTTMRLAIVAGPPLTKAATHTAMNAPDVPMMSTCPAPTRPTRTAWRTVVTPLTISAAKTPHDMYAVRLPGNPRHDNHGQDHRRHDDHRGLQPRADGLQGGRTLVRFVANVIVNVV